MIPRSVVIAVEDLEELQGLPDLGKVRGCASAR
jgi:hypothetical protein